MNFNPGAPDDSDRPLWNLVGKLIGRAFHGTRKSMAGGNTIDAPIIAAGGLTESSSLLGAAKGKLAGFDFVLLTNAQDRVMLVVTLPRNTGLHIIAIGDKSGELGEDIHLTQREWLEPVSLEGGFPERFEMYASKDRQMEVRQVFEPEVMWNFYQLCRAYDFELFHESVYFSIAANANDSEDTTNIVTDAEAFLNENAAFFNRLDSTYVVAVNTTVVE